MNRKGLRCLDGQRTASPLAGGRSKLLRRQRLSCRPKESGRGSKIATFRNCADSEKGLRGKLYDDWSNSVVVMHGLHPEGRYCATVQLYKPVTTAYRFYYQGVLTVAVYPLWKRGYVGSNPTSLTFMVIVAE